MRLHDYAQVIFSIGELDVPVDMEIEKQDVAAPNDSSDMREAILGD